MAEHLPRTMAHGVLLITLLCLLYVLNWVLVLWLLVACTLVFGWLRWLMLKRIEGMTGDTAGAMIEIIEVVTLVVMVIQ
jgi:adenosylcobinamide-GDP ribazoletransferase